MRPLYALPRQRRFGPVDEWVIQLVGDFEQPGQTHIRRCADEVEARRLALFWVRYRADIEVSVLRRDAVSDWTVVATLPRGGTTD